MVDPKQQKQFSTALRQAMDYMLEEGRLEDMISNAQSIGAEKAAASTVAMLLRGIYTAAESAGTKLSMDVVLAVGMHVLNLIAEAFIMKGLLKEADAKTFASKVSQMAMAQGGVK